MTDAVVGRHPNRGGTAASADDEPAAVRTGEPTREGADQLIADLYLAHGLALIRVALLLVGDKPTAEDVVQDAFLGLYTAVGRLSGTDKALAYLRACVVNGCRSVHRRRRTALVWQTRPAPEVWSAESAAIAREDSRVTLQAVARLPRRSREVLALRYYLDMKDREIAAALGISRGTVASTASRALTMLARELTEET